MARPVIEAMVACEQSNTSASTPHGPGWGENRARCDRVVAAFSPTILATREDASAVAKTMSLLNVDWVRSLDVANAAAVLLSDAARYTSPDRCGWSS